MKTYSNRCFSTLNIVHAHPITMKISTDHSCFKTPHYQKYTHQTRPNPYRKKRGRKRQLDELDDEGDGSGDGADGAGNNSFRGLDSDQQVVPEAIPFADADADADADAAADTTDGNGNNGDGDRHGCDTDAEVYPTRPRRLTRDFRSRHMTQMLESHGLFLPPQPPASLRARHQAIMAVILHRSVMTRDWARAKRAFAMLIRSDYIDIRKIWSLGSDILLMCPPPPEQTQTQTQTQTSRHYDNSAGPSTGPPPHVESKTTQNQTQNIEYLRRLILEFPFIGASAGQSLKHSTEASFSSFAAERAQLGAGLGPVMGQARSHSANAATFWPFLIAALVAASGSTETPSGPSPPRHDDGGDDGSAENGYTHQDNHGSHNYNKDQNTMDKHVEEKQGPSAQTQIHAMKIKEQLDELMNSPPWIDDPRLCCIRGMVCLWLADLQEPLLTNETAPDDDEHKGDGFDTDLDDDDDGNITPDSLISDNEDVEAAERRRHKWELRSGQSRQALLYESKRSLRDVVKNGGRVPGLLGRAVRVLRKMDHDK